MSTDTIADRLAALPPHKRQLAEQRLAQLRNQPQRHDISVTQQGLWFLEQLAAGSSVYTLAWRVDLDGELDVQALQAAAQSVVQRHSALRTGFAVVDGAPVQVVAPKVDVPVTVADLSGLPDAQRAAAFQAACEAETRTGFDLTQPPLIRFRLLRLAAGHHVLIIRVHHIVFDPLSLDILLRDLVGCYRARVQGSAAPEPPRRQYPDFSAWQRAHLREGQLQRLLDYWCEQLDGAADVLALPTDRPRPATSTYVGGDAHAVVPAELAHRLRELGAAERSTLFMVLLAAYEVLLSKHCGQTDVLVGTTVGGRARTEFDSTIGYFVNTVVLRGDLSGDPTFRQFLRQMRLTCLAAYDHQELPFDRLVEQLRPQRSLGHNPVFQTTFDFHQEAPRRLEAAGLAVRSVTIIEVGMSKFDLSLAAFSAGEEIGLDVEYATDLFDAGSVQRLLARFLTLLEQVAAHPDVPLSRLEILPSAERQLMLGAWNDTAHPVKEDSLARLFTARTARWPDATAVACGAVRVSYRELDQRASRLAHRLLAEGIGPEQVVALAVPNSVDTVVGVLAILKAGAIYCPIDTEYPPQRIAHALNDSRPSLILTTAKAHAAVQPAPAPVLVLDDAATMAELRRCPSTDPGCAAGGEQAAYIIYTSGSTGSPKGVVVPHRAVVNYLAFSLAKYPSLRSHAILHSSLAFDLTVTALFGPLLSGGCLHINGKFEMDDLDQACGFLKVTPSHLALLTAGKKPVAGDGELMAGGEPLLGETVRVWQRLRPGTSVINEYGPTETTVGCSTEWIAPGDDVPDGVLSIGRPMWNTRMYVLDAAGNPAPIGVVGELYVSGDCVARGYHDRAALTAQRFVPCPFETGQRMYRTGDLARWDGTGRLWFAGRVDDQIKIRGYRIEPGEIAEALAAHAAVEQAVIVAQSDKPGNAWLAAYVVPADPANPPSPAVLRAHLAEALPAYMIPVSYQLIDSVPLTSNGKLDRAALAPPDQTGAALAEYRQPDTDAEAIVAGIWAMVLKREQVGADDSFFDLGGHSLLAMSAIALVQDAFQVSVAIRGIFESPTPALFAERLREQFADDQSFHELCAAIRAVLELSDTDVQAELENSCDDERIANEGHRTNGRDLPAITASS
ncbi:MAG TPA: amino acid adenylation domain-containing protein [Candidatus Limnocylindrales bacterium]|nr:amino acid adenylation domain-containing protein [Candidatus Limnocylindrales bacterium]